MEPIGLALTQQPMNVLAIITLVIAALIVFMVSSRAEDEEEE